MKVTEGLIGCSEAKTNNFVQYFAQKLNCRSHDCNNAETFSFITNYESLEECFGCAIGQQLLSTAPMNVFLRSGTNKKLVILLGRGENLNIKLVTFGYL